MARLRGPWRSGRIRTRAGPIIIPRMLCCRGAWQEPGMAGFVMLACASFSFVRHSFFSFGPADVARLAGQMRSSWSVNEPAGLWPIRVHLCASVVPNFLLASSRAARFRLKRHRSGIEPCRGASPANLCMGRRYAMLPSCRSDLARAVPVRRIQSALASPIAGGSGTG
jgi:hypothetical protein